MSAKASLALTAGGDPASHGGDHWDRRARQAARLVRDGVRVLEIGVGKGTFRDEVKGRCSFVGADLNPRDDQTLAMDLDSDPLPAGAFDVIVLTGVLEYLHDLTAVAAKLRAAAPQVLISYCSIPGDAASETVVRARRERGLGQRPDVAAGSHAVWRGAVPTGGRGALQETRPVPGSTNLPVRPTCR